MKQNSGLTTEDAQRMICKGTLGGEYKEWTSEERKAACLRSNEVYEHNPGEGTGYSNAVLMAIGALFVVGIVMLYLKLKQRKSLPVKNTNRKK